MIIIDIGSGNGKRCCGWLRKYKDALVYAFEPDPRNFEELKKNIATLNDSERRRVKIFNCAVWSTNCVKEFNMCNDKSSSSLLPFVEENIKKWKYPPTRYYFKTIDKLKVKCVSLRTIMKEEGMKVIDCIRIDVQGCAKEIIKGIDNKKLKHIKEIYVKVNTTPFEIYKDQTYKEEIDQLLRKHYFKVVEGTPYSRNQELWVRYHSDVWQQTRRGKIYWLD
jgi:FkbM family methyltransferase